MVFLPAAAAAFFPMTLEISFADKTTTICLKVFCLIAKIISVACEER
jgi:hypothetical protein